MPTNHFTLTRLKTPLLPARTSHGPIRHIPHFPKGTGINTELGAMTKGRQRKGRQTRRSPLGNHRYACLAIFHLSRRSPQIAMCQAVIDSHSNHKRKITHIVDQMEATLGCPLALETRKQLRYFVLGSPCPIPPSWSRNVANFWRHSTHIVCDVLS